MSRTHHPRTSPLVDVVCGSLDPTLSPGVRESVEFFLTNLDASLALGDPALLADQIRWQTRRLGVLTPDIDVERLAAVTQEAITERLRPGEAAAAADHLANALQQAREIRRASGRSHATALSPLAQSYLDLALAGEDELAAAAVLASTKDALTLLLEVLEPAQVELGRLWLVGEVSVEDEHRVTACTQRVMKELTDRRAAPEPSGRRVLTVTVGAELHGIGLAIVMYALEQAGWTTQRIVDARDPAAVVEAALHHKVDALAISATMLDHVLDARALIEVLRADPRTQHLPVVVGGRPFKQAPRLATMVGADDWAVDARGAIRALDRVMQAQPEKADDGGLLAEFTRLNNELVTSQRDAARVNAQMTSRAEEVRRLVGMVAHDLASPLQTMLGYAGLLNGDAGLTHHQRDLAARIIRAGREMLTLVDDLGQGLVVDVDAPRARALVDIDDLVDSVLTHHQVAAAQRDVSVRHIRIPPGRSPGTVQGDVTQLERVLDRLVSNAVRVTPDGGLILVSVTVDADAVAVEVADEGPGLDAMRISELFSPMHDTHGSLHNPGIALGLSVCRRIAEQHGGALDVTSEPGNGATFTLVLPVATDALPLAVPPHGPPALPAATPSLHSRPTPSSSSTPRAPFLTVVHDHEPDPRSDEERRG